MSMPKAMKALCIAQPWSYCIFHKGKNVENREQNLKKRGTIAIYASANIESERFDFAKEEYGVIISADKLPFGAIVGFIDVVDTVTEDELTPKTKSGLLGPTVTFSRIQFF